MTGKRIHLTFLSLFIVSLLFADIPVGYYTNASGKSGAELKTSLYQILKEHKRIPYGSAYGSTWTVFRKSDVYPSGITGHPEGSIWDMYSNIVRYFPNGESGSNREMNIEHSVPKSWWGESSQLPFKKDASYDLHHFYDGSMFRSITVFTCPERYCRQRNARKDSSGKAARISTTRFDGSR